MVKRLIANNSAEVETFVLSSAIECIFGITNPTVINVLSSQYGNQVSFPTEMHQKFFFINLTDFVSPVKKEFLPLKGATIIESLVRVLERPILGTKESSQKALRAAIAFQKWLLHQIWVKFYIAEIQKTVRIKVPRRFIIRFSGNRCKHRAIRLNQMAESISELMRSNNIYVSVEEAFLAFDSFFLKFYDDILTCQATTIVAKLLKIQAGIIEYLQPVMKKARIFPKKPKGPMDYSYKIPKEIQGEFFKFLYYEILNFSAHRPSNHSIIVPWFFRKRW